MLRWFAPQPGSYWRERYFYPYATSILLVVLTTLAIALVISRIEFENVGIIYLLPVFVLAIRWGFLPAMFTALISVASSSFFFYPPFYSFQAHNWDNQVDLVLFTIVAAITSHLASRLRRKDEIELLREALIGSVSHELRTPLASILGAASVISESPAVKNDPRLVTLSSVIREEAERLNHDIQNLLDATRISSEGIRPKSLWIDPGDIVHTAIERRQRSLAAHKIKVTIADAMPLFQGDAVLIDQALGQVLSNAVKYSPAQSEIRVDVGQQYGNIAISVSDQGAGLTSEEQDRWGERFYRGARQAHTTTGSGLGTWIAKAFVEASGGTVHANSAGVGHGCNVIIMLPIPVQPLQEVESHADE